MATIKAKHGMLLFLFVFLKEILKKRIVEQYNPLVLFFLRPLFRVVYLISIENKMAANLKKAYLLLKTRAAILQVVIFISSIPCQRNR